MDKPRLILRIIFLALLIISIPLIVRQAWWLFLAFRDGQWITGDWWLFAISVVFFGFFLFFLGWRREVDWKSRSAFVAFIVALFFEMYGIPLSAYIMIGILGKGTGFARPDDIWGLSFHVFGYEFYVTLQMIIGTLITVLGLLIVVIGWIQLWSAHRADDGRLATTWVYAITRHPQYLGFFLITAGWMIHWPTILTLALGPVVIWRFASLAKREERDMREKFGRKYVEYSRMVPRWI